MINNLSLNFSNNCNMKCKYCDVNDSQYDLHLSNKKIREAIINGTFAGNIINKFSYLKEDMTEFSLWGLEPSINFDIVERVLIPIYDYFYNVDKLSYSTNCGLGYEPQEKLIMLFEQYSRPIHIDIQLSTDGPDWITSETRMPIANKKVREVAEYLEDISNILHNVTITSHLKPTLDMHYMWQLVDDDNKFEEYFKFFEDFSNDMNSRGKIHFDIATPTLVLPHYHTVEDGHIFRNFLHKINERDDGREYFLQTYDRYCEYINGNRNVNLCSAGLYTCSVNYNGDIFGCHNLFSLDYNNRRDKSIYSAQTTLDGKSKSQVMADQELIHYYFDTAKANFTSLILALVDAGQIEKKYAEDAQWRELLIYIITGIYCPFGQTETTKSIWIPTTSYLKLFGNGALDELVYHFERLKKNERDRN